MAQNKSRSCHEGTTLRYERITERHQLRNTVEEDTLLLHSSNMTGSTIFLGILSIFLAVSTFFCQVNIPKKPLGYVFNNGKPTAPIQLEMYADLTCPDCQHAWPVVKQVAEFYGPDKLRLVFQTFPLAFHTNAFVAAQSMPVAERYNSSLVFPWVDVLFKNQNQLYNFQTMDKNRFDINNIIASLAPKAGISQSVMKSGLTEASSERQAIVSWKHGCSKTVSSTPTYFINDVIVTEATSTWTVDQWKKLIDSLLSPISIHSSMAEPFNG